MTELTINCHRHGTSKVKSWDLSHDYIKTECGCSFRFNSGHIEDLTREHQRKAEGTYYGSNPDNDPNRLMWR